MPAVIPFKAPLDRRAAALVAHPDYQNDEQLLTTQQVAEWLQISPSWLEIGRTKGYGPKYVKLGAKRVRYRVGDTKQYLRDRTCQATADYERKWNEKRNSTDSNNGAKPPEEVA